MTDSNQEIVRLPIDRTQRDTASFEAVPAKRISKGVYRLLASPGFAPDVAAEDVVQVTRDGELRIIRRGGNVCIQVFFKECSNEIFESVNSSVLQLGGYLDGGMEQESGALLILTVPIGAGFPSIELAMQEIAELPHFDCWMYGNVYESDGVTPLNWWIE